MCDATTAPDHHRPIRVALVNDSTLVKGLAAMLADHVERVEVVEMDTKTPPVEPVDVVLKDAFALDEDLGEFVASVGARVVVYSFVSDPAGVRAALEAGVAGYVSKAVPPDQLVDALECVRAGEKVVEVPTESGASAAEADPISSELDWPGRAEGLTVRESEVVTLICRGLSNQDVARSLYLSINTVKTYIRTAYRAMGVTTRSQAVIWGLDHGFADSPARQRVPNDG